MDDNKSVIDFYEKHDEEFSKYDRAFSVYRAKV